MRRALVWLWLIGAILYVVGAWPFADDTHVTGRKEQATDSLSAPSVAAFPEGQLGAGTEAISPLPTPDSALLAVATEDVSSAEKPQAQDQISTAVSAERLVVRSAANIRSGPSSKSELVGTAPVGAELDVAERTAGWVRFVDPATSHTGWIHESLLVPLRTVVPSALSNTKSAAARPKSKVQARNTPRPSGIYKHRPDRALALGYAQGSSPEEFGPNKRRFGFFARRRMLREGWVSDEAELQR
jgi:SH3-like domain-containing protein